MSEFVIIKQFQQEGPPLPVINFDISLMAKESVIFGCFSKEENLYIGNLSFVYFLLYNLKIVKFYSSNNIYVSDFCMNENGTLYDITYKNNIRIIYDLDAFLEGKNKNENESISKIDLNS